MNECDAITWPEAVLGIGMFVFFGFMLYLIYLGGKNER
jgi:hypothetical protein